MNDLIVKDSVLHIPAAFVTPDMVVQSFVRKFESRTQSYSNFFTLTRESNDYYKAPRAMELPKGLSHLRVSDRRTGEKFSSIVRFTPPGGPGGSLRGYQSKAISICVSRLRETGQGILKSPCGSGKTTMGLAVAAELGFKTAILVGTEQLAKQWVAPVIELTGKVPGVFNGKLKDIEPDIVIFSIPSLMRPSLRLKAMFAKFGTVLLDEVHTQGAEEWSKGIQNFSGAYRLGLSATPKRADNMHELVFQHIGEIIHEVPTAELEDQGHILKPRVIVKRFNKNSCAYKKKSFTLLGKKFFDQTFDFVKTCNSMAKDPERNAFLAKIIVSAHAAGRTTLTVTNRLEHMTAIPKATEAIQSDFPEFGILKGGADFATEIKKTHSVGILSLAKQGLDKPDLEVIVMGVPVSDEAMLEQLKGRLNRKSENKKAPVLADVVDSVIPLNILTDEQKRIQLGIKLTPLEKSFLKRFEMYKEMNCEVMIEEGGKLFKIN
jgi:superfamily II DNA or RNA helicase